MNNSDSSHHVDEVISGTQHLYSHRRALGSLHMLDGAPEVRCFLLFGPKNSGKMSVIKATLYDVMKMHTVSDGEGSAMQIDELIRVVDMHWMMRNCWDNSSSNGGDGDSVGDEGRSKREEQENKKGDWMRKLKQVFEWATTATTTTQQQQQQQQMESNVPFRAIVFRNVDLLFHNIVDSTTTMMPQCIQRHLQQIASPSSHDMCPLYVFFTTCKPHMFPQELLDLCSIPVYVPLPVMNERFEFMRDQLKRVVVRLAAMIKHRNQSSSISILLQCASGATSSINVELYGKNGVVELPADFRLLVMLANISRGVSYLRMKSFIDTLVSKCCWWLQSQLVPDNQQNGNTTQFILVENDIVQLAEPFFSTTKCTPYNSDVAEFARKFYNASVLADVEDGSQSIHLQTYFNSNDTMKHYVQQQAHEHQQLRPQQDQLQLHQQQQQQQPPMPIPFFPLPTSRSIIDQSNVPQSQRPHDRRLENSKAARKRKNTSPTSGEIEFRFQKATNSVSSRTMEHYDIGPVTLISGSRSALPIPDAKRLKLQCETGNNGSIRSGQNHSSDPTVLAALAKAIFKAMLWSQRDPKFMDTPVEISTISEWDLLWLAMKLFPDVQHTVHGIAQLRPYIRNHPFLKRHLSLWRRAGRPMDDRSLKETFGVSKITLNEDLMIFMRRHRDWDQEFEDAKLAEVRRFIETTAQVEQPSPTQVPM